MINSFSFFAGGMKRKSSLKVTTNFIVESRIMDNVKSKRELPSLAHHQEHKPLKIKLKLFFLDFIHINNTVFIPAVIQGRVATLLLLGCMGRGIDRLRINPGTGHQQSPGEIRTRPGTGDQTWDWTKPLKSAWQKNCLLF
jgi:hypothetical protein